MAPQDLISANDFCLYHQVSYRFITSLEEAGLIEITTIEQESYLHLEQLGEIERMSRLHNDLGINAEGVDAIFHLLQKMNSLQKELKELKQRLALYEKITYIHS